MGTPTRQEDFNPGALRRRVAFRPIFANGVTPALRASQFGTEPGIGPLDDGALKVVGGVWKIFSTAFEGRWNDFDPDDLGQFSHADHFSAYGAGWSSGGGAFTGHGPTHLGQIFLDQLGREATPEELEDASYGKNFGLDLSPPAQPPAGPPSVPTPLPPAQPPPVTPPNPPVRPPTDPVAPGAVPDFTALRRLANQMLAEIKRQEAALKAWKAK